MDSLHNKVNTPKLTWGKFSDFLERFATGPTVLIFLALQVLYNIVVFPQFANHTPQGDVLPILDLKFGFSPETAYAVLVSYGQEGRERCLFVTWVVDMIYPVIYTIFNVLALTFLAKKILPAGSIWKLVSLLPFLIFISDLIENRAIGSMINSFPSPNVAAAHLASMANQVKWGLEIVCVLLMLVGLVVWILRRKDVVQR